jgi:uroporphyrinogen decarboxylase
MNRDSLRKPDKERIVAALRGETTDRVPHFEVAVEELVVEKILGRDAGSTLAASRGSSDKTFVAPPMDPDDYLDILDFNGQDVIGFEALWVPFKYRDDKGELHIVNDGRIKSFDDLEKIVLPDWELDFAPRRQYFSIYNEAIKKREGSNAGTFLLTGAMFQSCYQFLVGFEDFFMATYTDREFIEHMLDLSLEYYMKVVEISIESDLSFLFLGDDIAFKQGMLMNPDMLLELWLPRYKKLVALARQSDIPIMFHSCGNITDIFDNAIMELGFDGINPIEPYSMDIYKIKQQYGDRITISGNVDIAGPLAFGSPEDVKKDVREHLERLMPGGRYICSTNHSIMNDIPIDNYKAMIDTIIEHGVY